MLWKYWDSDGNDHSELSLSSDSFNTLDGVHINM